MSAATALSINPRPSSTTPTELGISPEVVERFDAAVKRLRQLRTSKTPPEKLYDAVTSLIDAHPELWEQLYQQWRTETDLEVLEIFATVLVDEDRHGDVHAYLMHECGWKTTD